MATAWTELRFATRRLRASPGFAAIAILTLAVGIGANAAIFSVVNAVLLRPLPYPDPDRLVMIAETAAGEPGNVGFATFSDWREGATGFAGMSAMSDWQPTLTIAARDPEAVEGASVNAEYFDVLGVQPLLGRTFQTAEDRANGPRVVILGYELWQRSFAGDPQVIERTVSLNGIDRTVVGVLPPGFQPLLSYESKPVQLYRPLGYDSTLPQACRTCRHLRVVGRLRPELSIDGATAELGTLMRTIVEGHPADYSAAGVSLRPLHEQLVGGLRPALRVLWGAVGFLLLVACANVANLLLARSAARRKELSLRIALGAGRSQVVGYLFSESLVLAGVGGAVGILLAAWGTRALVALSPADLPRIQGVAIDGPVLGFTLLVSVLTALAFGLLPALRAGRTDLRRSLDEGGRGAAGSRGHQTMRGALVVADVALALVLLAGAGLTLRSLGRLLQEPAGFEPQQLLTMRLSVFGPRFSGADGEARTQELFARAEEELAALPGVVAAGLVSQLPLSGDYDQYGVRAQDVPLASPADAPSAYRYSVTPGYLRALDIPILQGRELGAQDRAGAPLVLLVNELFAERMWPHGQALGKQVQFGGPEAPWRTVVGVVGNVRQQGLDEPFELQFYAPESQMESADGSMRLVARVSGDPLAIADSARRRMAALDSGVLVSHVSSMGQLVGATVAQRRFTMVLLGLFAGTALLLAAIGVYGLMAHSVARRTGEFGIRMALGARPLDVLRLVLGQGMRVVALGVAIGIAGALGLSGVLRGQLFRIQPTDPVTLAVVATALLLVAALACWLPARRAVRLQPVAALRIGGGD